MISVYETYKDKGFTIIDIVHEHLVDGLLLKTSALG